MKKIWTTHCKDAKEKEEWLERLAYSQDVFKVLKGILEKKYEKACSDRRGVVSYMTQNWTAYQADKNATERTLLELIELLPTLEK